MSRSLSPGLYEALITRDLARVLEELTREQYCKEEVELDPADAHVALARHVGAVLVRVLASFPEKERIEEQLSLANDVLTLLAERAPVRSEGAPDDLVDPPPRQLRALATPSPTPTIQMPASPTIPLSAMDLIVNARGEPRVGNALEREIPSAEFLDCSCPGMGNGNRSNGSCRSKATASS